MLYKTGNFSLEVPDDWQDRSIISFVATVAPNEFAPNVVVTKETVDAEMSVEDYAHRQFSITQAEVEGLSVVEQTNISINGRPAVQIIQKISAHNLKLQQLQTFILTNSEIFIVTCTATTSSFAQHLPRFEKISQSINLSRF